MKHEISRKLTIYSFFMAFAVMLFHLTLFENMNIESDIFFDKALYAKFDQLISKMCRMALNYFFMSSAFLLYYNSKGNVKRKIISRLKSIINPFIVWNTGYAAYMVLIDRAEIWDMKTIFDGFSFFPFDGPLWFTFALILGLILFPLLSALDKKWSCVVFVCSIMWVYYAWDYSWLQAEYANWFVRLSGYIPAYFVGFILAKLAADKIIMELYNEKVVCIISCIVLFILWGPFEHTFQRLTLWRVIEPALEVVLIWCVLPSKLFKKKVPFPFTLSFFMYSGHMAASKIVGKVTRPIFQEKLLSVKWNGLEGCVLRILFSIWAYGLLLVGAYLLHRFTPKIFSILNGGNRERE